LLPDGPDQATARLLDGELRGLARAGSEAPRGAAAAFNRLTRATAAEVMVFLESGARVAPGWLEALLGALAEDPTVGLAGPSTDSAWNQQAVAALVPMLPALSLAEA